jgi:hypothetical protein
MTTREQMHYRIEAMGGQVGHAKRPLTSDLALGTLGGDVIVGVHSDTSTSRSIHAIGDAVHWWHHHHRANGANRIRVVYGARPDIDEVLEGASLLIQGIQSRQVTVDLEVDFKKATIPTTDFSQAGDKWLNVMKSRLDDGLPAGAAAFSTMVGRPSFRWYRTVTGASWSGRIEGLEVCRMSSDGNTLTINVGRDGKNGAKSRARKMFLGELNRSFSDAIPDNLGAQADLIRSLADAREAAAGGGAYDEHFVESRVLRKALPVELKGVALDPVFSEFPCQFPTMWETRKRQARYVDAFMRQGDVPYVVELKIGNTVNGQYFRDAITQVALYREFLKQATPLHGWLKTAFGLDASCCEAVVAFPVDLDAKRDQVAALDEVAAYFGVHVVGLKPELA